MNSPKNILIADDHPQVLKLFKRLLIKGGYSVTAVDSGAEALNILNNQPVDLLLLDLEMPQTDGFDILRNVRENRPGLRVLVISGYMNGAMLKASEFLGATATLNKTEAPARLLETVGRLLHADETANGPEKPEAFASH